MTKQNVYMTWDNDRAEHNNHNDRNAFEIYFSHAIASCTQFWFEPSNIWFNFTVGGVGCEESNRMQQWMFKALPVSQAISSISNVANHLRAFCAGLPSGLRWLRRADAIFCAPPNTKGFRRNLSQKYERCIFLRAETIKR
jgi:hypothetical protein